MIRTDEIVRIIDILQFATGSMCDNVVNVRKHAINCLLLRCERSAHVILTLVANVTEIPP